MSNTNKKEPEDIYNKEVLSDEMQRAVSFELEHKILWLWYALNSVVMWIAYFMLEFSDWTAPVPFQFLIALYYGVMLFCLSLYNLKAAGKGVLDSFSRYQKGMKGWKYFIGVFNVIIPISSCLNATDSERETANGYIVFFTAVLLMAVVYESISWYCVKLNQKVCDGIAADGENEEE